MFDYFEISLSLDEHYDYKVKSPKQGKTRGAKKQKKRKHRDLKSQKKENQNSNKGKRGERHGDVSSNEQTEVNNYIVLKIAIASSRLFSCPEQLNR